MVKESAKKGFVQGALVLMLFGLLSKIVGAIYRIPLTSIISAEGMGLYQMVFPLYTLLLTISSSGIPSSISKLISEEAIKKNYKQVDRILKVSFCLLVGFSIFCSLIVLIGSGAFASFQGNSDAKICYRALAPAIIFVGLISGFRGYFQGLECMTPSAVSGFIEQIVKLGAGLLLAGLFIDRGVKYGVLGALLGVSISEAIAFLYLLIRYFLGAKKRKELLLNSEALVKTKRQTAKDILSLSVFVTIGGLIMPLTMLIDSVAVINILKSIGFSVKGATTLFGLQTGTVGSIVNMPVVLSLSVATAVLPCISKLKASGDICGLKASASKAVFIVIILALPASVGCLSLAEPILKLLYGRGLSIDELTIAKTLLEVASMGIFYLAMVQVTAGILQGINKFFVPVISLGVGGAVKIILNLILVKVPSLNILGAEIASVSCYIVALIINLSVLKKQNIIKLDYKIFVVLIASFGIYFSKYIFKLLLDFNVNYFLSLILTVVFVVLVYFFIIFILYRKSFKHKKMCKQNK